ncbi:MAG TPA: hypothetical protein VK987_08095 [Anaerolineae bacterium]|jgi:hypothetical protein|nr:hypothetical protein [Anaerolineae bacterium]
MKRTPGADSDSAGLADPGRHTTTDELLAHRYDALVHLAAGEQA